MLFFEIMSGIAAISSFMVVFLWARIFSNNIKNAEIPYHQCSLCLVSAGLLISSITGLSIVLAISFGWFFDIQKHIAIAIVLCSLTVADLFFILAACINYNYFQFKLFLALSACWIAFCLPPFI